MIAHPLTLCYDKPAIIRELVYPASGEGLSPSRDDLRIDSGEGGMFIPGRPASLVNAPNRVSKVSGRTIWSESVPQMIATLKNEITRGQYGAEAHLVAIDEVMPKFSNHWGAGLRFSKAMWILHKEHTPWGGTWASRVEVYISPSLLMYGGNYLKGFSKVMPALAMAGGVHLEMYHGGKSPLKGFSTTLWRQAPAAFLKAFKQYEGKTNRIHFVFTATTSPMKTSWNSARSTIVNREILANGPDEWSLKTQAPQWLSEYNRYFH